MATMVQQGQPQQPIAHEEKAVSKVQRIITLGLFWGAFLSFLAVSIPHVAWLYQSYEPKDGSWYTLVTTYGVAVGIDVMIAWLSWVQVAGKGARSGVTWVFIVALSLLSWYANYLYGMNNDPIRQADIWNISIAFGITTTGYITPCIISAVPLFSLAYTAMLHTVMNQKVETVEEMRSRLTELRDRKEVEKELKEVQGGSIQGRVKGAVLGTVQAGKETVTGIKKIVQEEEVQPASLPEVPQSVEAKVDVQPSTDESDKLVLTVAFLQRYPDATDEQIADYLGMKRPASARFWRLKAQEIATLNHAQKVEVKQEEIISPLGTQSKIDGGSNLLPTDDEDAELFEEVSEEQYQNLYNTEPVDTEEPITDPEVEVVREENSANGGGSTEQHTSTLNILTRRKPLIIAEVAEVLNCSERYVRELRKQGKLLAEDQEGKLIKAGSVRSYLANRKVRIS